MPPHCSTCRCEERFYCPHGMEIEPTSFRVSGEWVDEWVFLKGQNCMKCFDEFTPPTRLLGIPKYGGFLAFTEMM